VDATSSTDARYRSFDDTGKERQHGSNRVGYARVFIVDELEQVQDRHPIDLDRSREADLGG
jgi:hypothetical protein